MLSYTYVTWFFFFKIKFQKQKHFIKYLQNNDILLHSSQIRSKYQFWLKFGCCITWIWAMLGYSNGNLAGHPKVTLWGWSNILRAFLAGPRMFNLSKFVWCRIVCVKYPSLINRVITDSLIGSWLNQQSLTHLVIGLKFWYYM